MSEDYEEMIGTSIDKIINIDMRAGGLTDRLYKAIREKFGRPLALLAAEKLVEVVKPGDTVIIATGFPTRWWVDPNIAEIDGPPGAACLARSLKLGLKAIPVLITEKGYVDMLKATCRGAGLLPVGFEESKIAANPPIPPIWGHVHPLHTCTVTPFPIDDEQAKEAATKLIDETSPTAVITIEKPGPNEKGAIHHLFGANINKYAAKVHYLVEEAKSKGILTIGCGDGGNEIGYGVIEKELKKIIPTGSKCKCGCGGGVGCATKTDVFVNGGTSNWAGYGIAAALSYILNDPTVLHDMEIEKRILRECADAGAIVGGFWAWSGFCAMDNDGIPERIHAYIIDMLHALIQIWQFRTKGIASNEK